MRQHRRDGVVTTYAITMVKDEADIVATTVGVMLEQCDGVIVADNNSTDGTRDLLADLARQHKTLTVLDDPEVASYQAKKMTNLAHFARERGATWAIPFDADEYWVCGWGRFADVLASHT